MSTCVIHFPAPASSNVNLTLFGRCSGAIGKRDVSSDQLPSNGETAALAAMPPVDASGVTADATGHATATTAATRSAFDRQFISDPFHAGVQGNLRQASGGSMARRGRG